MYNQGFPPTQIKSCFLKLNLAVSKACCLTVYNLQLPICAILLIWFIESPMTIIDTALYSLISAK